MSTDHIFFTEVAGVVGFTVHHQTPAGCVRVASGVLSEQDRHAVHALTADQDPTEQPIPYLPTRPRMQVRMASAQDWVVACPTCGYATVGLARDLALMLAEAHTWVSHAEVPS